jgi:hypothetical protein
MEGQAFVFGKVNCTNTGVMHLEMCALKELLQVPGGRTRCDKGRRKTFHSKFYYFVLACVLILLLSTYD